MVVVTVIVIITVATVGKGKSESVSHVSNLQNKAANSLACKARNPNAVSEHGSLLYVNDAVNASKGTPDGTGAGSVGNGQAESNGTASNIGANGSVGKPTGKKKPRMTSVALGAIPVVILGALVSMDHIPGTNISLAVPYAAEGKGPTFNTLSDVHGTPVVDVTAGEGFEVDEHPNGNLNMTTVSVRTNMTVVQAFTRWIASDDTMVPIEKIYPPGTNREQFQEQNQAAFSASEAAATVAAMNYLDIPTRTAIAQVLEISAGKDQLADGDVLHKVDGQEIHSPEDVQNAVRGHKPNETIHLEFERDGKQREADVELLENPHAKGEALLGITMTSVPDADIDVAYNLQDVGGPSAGMIFSLAVIDKLSDGDLTSGKFVAGTGTIAPNSQVGPIGGIAHKVAKSAEVGAELFLAPADNCAEATSVDHGEMVIAKVETLDDAIAAMDAFANGDDVVTCGE